VVFFGSFNLLTNEFDNDTKQRLTNAIHLYKSEKNDHIICVGNAMAKKRVCWFQRDAKLFDKKQY
jgi:hypothetical protein